MTRICLERLTGACVLVFGLGLQATPASALQNQARTSGRGFVGHVAVLSANSLIGAATAAITAALSGRETPQAFAKGALGGAVMFASKRVAVADWDPAPFLGGTLAALGGAMVQQASSSGLLADSVRLPIGPLRITLNRSRPSHPRLSVSVSDLGLLVAALSRNDLEFDWGRSLSAMAPVFQTGQKRIYHDGERVTGVAIGRLILLDGQRPDDAYSHEVVHVIQHDFLELALDQSLEALIRRDIKPARWLPACVEFNLIVPLVLGVDDAVWHGDGLVARLTEAEASWFKR